VSIDVDASRPDVAPPSKLPLRGYMDPEQTISSKEKDWYGLRKVEKLLNDVFGRRARRGSPRLRVRLRA